MSAMDCSWYRGVLLSYISAVEGKGIKINTNRNALVESEVTSGCVDV
jgi:hypothetical protein